MRRNVLLVLLPLALVAADAAQDAKDELKKLEGNWVMVSGEEKGEKVSEQRVKDTKMTIVAGKHTVTVGKDTFVGTQKLDPSKNPKEIDATNAEGKMLGIYKLDGDQFTVCFAPLGKDRPKEFTSKSGTGEFVHVWKREKK